MNGEYGKIETGYQARGFRKGPKMSEFRHAIRIFLIELLVYAILVTVYFLLVLRFLEAPLRDLFWSNIQLYAVVALFLVVGQGVVLDILTTFLVDRLDMQEFE